jgi:hypothetical protein
MSTRTLKMILLIPAIPLDYKRQSPLPVVIPKPSPQLVPKPLAPPSSSILGDLLGVIGVVLGLEGHTASEAYDNIQLAWDQSDLRSGSIHVSNGEKPIASRKARPTPPFDRGCPRLFRQLDSSFSDALPSLPFMRDGDVPCGIERIAAVADSWLSGQSP